MMLSICGLGWCALVALSSRRMSVYVIVHECYHGTNHILQERGVAPSHHNNDEHYAYYISWLFDKVYKIWLNNSKEVKVSDK